VIERRLNAARGEMTHAPEFDFVIINERFEQAVAELVAMSRHRLRYASQAARRPGLFDRLGIRVDAGGSGKMGVDQFSRRIYAMARITLKIAQTGSEPLPAGAGSRLSRTPAVAGHAPKIDTKDKRQWLRCAKSRHRR